MELRGMGDRSEVRGREGLRSGLGSRNGLDMRSLRSLGQCVVQLIHRLLPSRGCLGVRRRRGLVWVSVLYCFPVVLLLYWLDVPRWLACMAGLVMRLMLCRLIRLNGSWSGMNRLGLVDLCRMPDVPGVDLRSLVDLNVVDLIVDIVPGERRRIGGFGGLQPRSRPSALCTLCALRADSRRDGRRTIVAPVSCVASVEVWRGRKGSYAGEQRRRFWRGHACWRSGDWRGGRKCSRGHWGNSGHSWGNGRR